MKVAIYLKNMIAQILDYNSWKKVLFLRQLVQVNICKFTKLSTEHMLSNIFNCIRFKFQLLFTYSVKIYVNSSFKLNVKRVLFSQLRCFIFATKSFFLNKIDIGQCSLWIFPVWINVSLLLYLAKCEKLSFKISLF